MLSFNRTNGIRSDFQLACGAKKKTYIKVFWQSKAICHCYLPHSFGIDKNLKISFLLHTDSNMYIKSLKSLLNGAKFGFSICILFFSKVVCVLELNSAAESVMSYDWAFNCNFTNILKVLSALRKP